MQLPIFLSALVLAVLNLVDQRGRAQLRAKSYHDWILDTLGLGVQGVLIPLLQITVVYQILYYALPSYQASVRLFPLISFLLSFVLVDYLYYWNHRLFHHVWLWPIHQVHHTVTQMDILGTSRNTLWTSFFIIYLWVHGFFMYVLADPSMYLLGVSLTAALDLWRHSYWTIPQQHWLYRYVAPWLILPHDHAQHHASDVPRCNFGANLNLWDRFHGTYQENTANSPILGIKTRLTMMQQLLFPFR